jgi:hypothetical protein
MDDKIMMKITKPNLRTLSAALTFGVLSFGFAPAAMAISTYDAAASFSLTLTDVSCGGCNGWDVTAFGSGSVFLSESGVASATGTTSVIDPAVSMSILDTITQSSISSGSASNGLAATDALTDLEIIVDNFSGQALTFSFDYSIMLDASTTGIADASASVDFLDDLGFVDILANVDAVDGSAGMLALNGRFAFDLADGEFNLISGFVDSFGSAEAIPVPAAVWLFGSGLLGLVGIARRKQAA